MTNPEVEKYGIYLKISFNFSFFDESFFLLSSLYFLFYQFFSRQIHLIFKLTHFPHFHRFILRFNRFSFNFSHFQPFILGIINFHLIFHFEPFVLEFTQSFSNSPIVALFFSLSTVYFQINPHFLSISPIFITLFSDSTIFISILFIFIDLFLDSPTF